MKKQTLTVEALQIEAKRFAKLESVHPEPTIFGVTDGKAIGTYLEHKLHAHLEAHCVHTRANAASGIDFPGLAVDVKVTSVKQPQSAASWRHAAIAWPCNVPWWDGSVLRWQVACTDLPVVRNS